MFYPSIHTDRQPTGFLLAFNLFRSVLGDISFSVIDRAGVSREVDTGLFEEERIFSSIEEIFERFTSEQIDSWKTIYSKSVVGL